MFSRKSVGQSDGVDEKREEQCAKRRDQGSGNTKLCYMILFLCLLFREMIRAIWFLQGLTL